MWLGWVGCDGVGSWGGGTLTALCLILSGAWNFGLLDFMKTR